MLEKNFDFFLEIKKLTLSVSFDCQISFLWKIGSSKLFSPNPILLKANTPELLLNETFSHQASYYIHDPPSNISSPKPSRDSISQAKQPLMSQNINGSFEKSILAIILSTSKGRKIAGLLQLDLTEGISKANLLQIRPLDKCPDPLSKCYYHLTAQEIPPKLPFFSNISMETSFQYLSQQKGLSSEVEKGKIREKVLREDLRVWKEKYRGFFERIGEGLSEGGCLGFSKEEKEEFKEEYERLEEIITGFKEVVLLKAENKHLGKEKLLREERDELRKKIGYLEEKLKKENTLFEVKIQEDELKYKELLEIQDKKFKEGIETIEKQRENTERSLKEEIFKLKEENERILAQNNKENESQLYKKLWESSDCNKALQEIIAQKEKEAIEANSRIYKTDKMLDLARIDVKTQQEIILAKENEIKSLKESNRENNIEKSNETNNKVTLLQETLLEKEKKALEYSIHLSELEKKHHILENNNAEITKNYHFLQETLKLKEKELLNQQTNYNQILYQKESILTLEAEISLQKELQSSILKENEDMKLHIKELNREKEASKTQGYNLTIELKKTITENEKLNNELEKIIKENKRIVIENERIINENDKIVIEKENISEGFLIEKEAWSIEKREFGSLIKDSCAEIKHLMFENEKLEKAIKIERDERVKEKKEIKREMDEIKCENKEMNFIIEEIKKESNETKLEMKKINTEMRLEIDDVNIKNNEMGVEIENLKKENYEINLQKEEINIKNNEMRVEIENLKKENYEINLKKEEINIKNNEMRVEIENLKKENNEINLKTEEIKNQNSFIQEETTELKKTNSELNKENIEMKRKLLINHKGLENRIIELEEENIKEKEQSQLSHSKITTDLSDLTTKLNSLENEKLFLETTNSSLKTEATALENSLVSLSSEIKSLTNQNTLITSEITSLTTKITLLTNENNSLTSKNIALTKKDINHESQIISQNNYISELLQSNISLETSVLTYRKTLFLSFCLISCLKKVLEIEKNRFLQECNIARFELMQREEEFIEDRESFQTIIQTKERDTANLLEELMVCKEEIQMRSFLEQKLKKIMFLMFFTRVLERRKDFLSFDNLMNKIVKKIEISLFKSEEKIFALQKALLLISKKMISLKKYNNKLIKENLSYKTLNSSQKKALCEQVELIKKNKELESELKRAYFLSETENSGEKRGLLQEIILEQTEIRSQKEKIDEMEMRVSRLLKGKIRKHELENKI